VLVCFSLLIQPARAQVNPTPNTFSTLAGSYAGTYTAGGVCGGASSGSKYTALDAMGNGCPLTQAILGPNLSGIGVDGAGNVFVFDYTNGQVREIDAKSGIVTKVVGNSNTLCSSTPSASGTVQDNLGSGCVNTSALGPKTARGMNVDPWGNVILGSYNSNMINVVCLAASPLCPGTTGRKQVGSMYRVAGCIATQAGGATAASGSTAYTGGDNTLASPFQNLAGDVTAWGLTGTSAAAATVGATGNACGSTSGGVNQARNAQADKFGNVYIADTNGQRYRVVLGPASYNGVTNPMFAIINMNPKYSANEGFIYTILGSFSTFTSGGVTYDIPTAAGGACSSASTATATDTFGDGCAFFETGKPAAASTPAGIGVDKDGNPIFSDTQDSVVRVMYVGGTTMANIISLNNGGITPVAGTVYAIEGTGTATKSGTPALNVSSSSVSTSNTKVAADGQGNIYLSDGKGVNIIDSTTGYLRRPITTGGTLCAGGAANGDGCPAGSAQTWTALSSVGAAITVDNLGNLYLADSTGLVRKVLAGTLYSTAVGSSFTQSVVLHEPAGTTGITAALLNASPGITIPTTAPVCTLYTTSSDNTADCTVLVSFAPTVAGKVGATLSITNAGGGGATTLYPLVGVATSAALVTDTSSPITSTLASFGASGQPTSLAVDTGGNLYTVDKHALAVEQISPAGVVTAVGTAPAGADQVAVDTTGNVYVTAVGAGSVTKFTLASAGGSYTSSTITNAAVAKPQGIAFDVQGNMYLSDATTASVYQVANNAGYASLAAPTVVASGLANPTLLAFDGSGNLIIADSGVVDRVNGSTGVLATVASASAGGVAISGLTPVGIAADAGDNVYIQDGASKSVIEIPYQSFAPNDVTVLTGETTPSGVAVDGMGNVYVADSGLAATAVIKVARAAESYTFPTGTTTYSGTFSNTGNASSIGYAETDAAEFPYTGSGSGGCGTITGTSVLLTGGACTFSVTPNLGSNGLLVNNTTTLLPAATSTGSLVLTAHEPAGTTYATTTTVNGPTTAVYLGTGTEISFTVAESSSNSNSQNGETVNVTIDSGSPSAYVLSGGSVSVPLSGLTVGSHTVTAVYPGDGTYLTSNGSASFSITQAATSVSWTPGATTQQYSAAIGAGVLNATASAPGSFIYTATPSGGSAQFIHSASYLPIGSYSLRVTFVPTDSVDYAQSTVSVASYTVSKASTTAAVGATQFLVAADGTGNYTSVQAAVNALPTGGSVYIKPGTYTGNITVVQPNLALRGLGGDPTKVILTHAGGAFGGSGTYAYAGEFQVGMENGYQLPTGSSQFTGDEGSATLVVAKGINTALSSSTTIPNGFYGENFTLANTYDSDATTTTTTYLPGSNSGTCTASEGPAQTYNSLYNNSLLCASQALAIWTTSDLSVMNNVYATSLQDTIYSASQGSGSNGYVPARQYWFRGKVTGDVDYIFGDSAAVFDNTSIYTMWHGATATGTETIHAQNKAVQTGSSNDYLSGYVMNSDVFTSQSTGMTNLYFGRPYGNYSTWIMLNSYVDQVNPLGYTTGLGPTFPADTFAEFNDLVYTDPATNSADLNGVVYLGTGGNTGAGVTGVREAGSTNPGTAMFGNSIPTTMTQAQAQTYFPANFLGQSVSSLVSSTPNWNPTTAISAAVNAFVPTGSSASIASGSSITLLMRPQTPGLGAVSNGVYTIPTGTYTLSDTFGGSTITLASGSLDASGEAYLTTSTLGVGSHSITMAYSGDSNFSASTTSTPYVINVTASGTTVPAISIQPAAGATYGAATTVAVSVSATSGTTVPSGLVQLSVDGGTSLSGSLSSAGIYTFTLPSLSAGSHSLSVTYSGDSSFGAATSSSATVVARSVLQVAANSFSIVAGQAVPTYTASITGFVNGDVQSSVITGAPSLTTSPATPSAAGIYPITASTGTLAASNYTFTFTNGSLAIQSATQAAAVATGDSRSVSEPVIPATCATLTAALTSVNDDIPASVDATVSNPDGARIQAALNGCASTNHAVRLSADGAGHNAYLTGPLNMPTGATLLVDPGVVVYFSRNVQDYDVVAGTHTCGTVNSNTATSSCLPLININNVSNVGILGFGKLDGRGGDPLLNAFPSSNAGQSWWGLSSIANTGGNQQNPRFIQVGNSSNVTLYKITLRNSPLFHISTSSSGTNGLTAWDIKIVTPTNARNTDGVDPDQAKNFTITQSWISDGDDNIAVGASGSSSSASSNMSITNNHFFAGHGESIGSYTSAGVSNILFDNNMLSGNSSVDGNSTGIRIKSANDRGGVVQNIQYSNSCFQNHRTEIQFTPLYNSNTGTLTPNFKNILMQNLSFLTAGTVGLTGASNSGTVNALGVTLDNVSFASLASSYVTPAPTNVALTYGPGQVSSNFITDYASFVGSNGNTLTDNRTASSLVPVSCNFTAIAPELTGPAGLPQTILSGQTATAMVILTPAVAGSPYPTGSVTLSDGASSTTTVTLSGTGDTLSIPLSNLSVGTHTFTATYSGDSNYIPTVSGTPYSTTAPYLITVNTGTLATTTTTLSGVPTTSAYGTALTATATVTGSAATGTVQFVANGAVYATVALGSGGTAQATLNLLAGSYTISAIYSGDALNASSTSSASAASVTALVQTITFTDSLPATGTYSSGLTYPLSATGGASGNAVVFSVLSGPGTISGSTLTVTGAGTIQIAANQAGNANYAAATQGSQSIVINQPTTQTITFTDSLPATAVYTSALTYPISATGGASGNAVTFSVTGSATLSGSTLSIIGVGTVTITANQAASGVYSAATATQSITINAAAQAISFTDSLPASVSYSTGLTYPLSATGGASGNVVTYSVSGPATLAGSTLTITGAGTVTITANQAGNSNYSAATAATQSIVINAVAQTISFTDSLPASVTYNTGLTDPISATGGASGNPVTFSVTGPGTISGSTLTVTGAGTIQIAANQTGNTNYAAAPQITQSIVVNAATQTINFTAPASPVIFGVSPITLVATGGASGNAVVFSVVSGPGTVSGNVLTVTGAGTIQIAANQAGNANYLAATSVTQSIVVNLAGAAATPTFSPVAGTYAPGQAVTISDATTGATIYYTTNGTTPTTSSSVYKGAISLSASETLEAIATANGYSPSAVATAIYTAAYPVPVISSISPAITTAGGAAFLLTVNGTGFTVTSTVVWGSSAVTTQYVSPTQLTVQIPAAEIDNAGTVSIAVQNPAPGGGTSNILQLEVNSVGSGSTAPTITTLTATVTAGTTASYPVTLPSSVSSVSVTCLNLPVGATCSFASNVVTISTSSTTPKGTYSVTVVFTEAVSGTSTGFILLPIFLLPLALMRKKLAARKIWLTACLGVMLLATAATIIGCGGGGNSSNSTPTHQVISSSVVTLTVQ
jgi:hypothetical protein